MPPSCALLGGFAIGARVWACGRGQAHRQTDRQTDRNTDARDHSTFLVVYDSREM